MIRFYRLIAVLVFFSVTGCAASNCYRPPAGPQQEAGAGRGVIHIKDVPVFEQEKDRCGPAAMASMLVFSGVDTRPGDIEEMVYDTESRGSLQISLVAAARRHNRVAYELNGVDDLLAGLSAGQPVLVLLNKGLSWLPAYHYSVVTGFDPQKRVFILAGGRACEEELPETLFRRMWSRADNWGLMVLEPDDIPPVATPDRWIDALYALERMDAHKAALKGYNAALEKWPGDPVAIMGKANTLYAAGRLKDAANVLEKAVEIHPESAPLFNNLAQVMLELGNNEAAFEAATRAVEIGGPHAETCRQTLEDIRKAMGDR
ncbi:MAG: PA2778 family cysteine peptidase [Desulfosalsimonas sp.]